MGIKYPFLLTSLRLEAIANVVLCFFFLIMFSCYWSPVAYLEPKNLSKKIWDVDVLPFICQQNLYYFGITWLKQFFFVWILNCNHAEANQGNELKSNSSGKKSSFCLCPRFVHSPINTNLFLLPPSVKMLWIKPSWKILLCYQAIRYIPSAVFRC